MSKKLNSKKSNKNKLNNSNNKKRNRTLANMPTALYKELVNLCYIQSCGSNEKMMVLYLAKELDTISGVSYEIDAVGNILVGKGYNEGKIYPCVAAHMDTVHSIVDNYTIYSDNVDNNIRLYAKSGNLKAGIGGDDKCGIFACLYMLKQLPNLKVVFFTQEETGLKGSNKISHNFFDDVGYVIQLDRRGRQDFIDKYIGDKTVSQEFSSEIGKLKKEYGFKSTSGIITDSINLWSNSLGLSCVNISAGYYRPHSVNEYIDVNKLWNSILFTKAIMQILKHKRYECMRPESKWKNNWKYNGTGNQGKRYRTNGDSLDVYKKCKDCKQYKKETHGFVSPKDNKWICFDCWGTNGKKKPKLQNSNPSTWHRCFVCNYTYYRDQGTYRKDFQYQWVCDTCFKASNTMICHICKKPSDDCAEFTKLDAAEVGIELMTQRGIICTNCLTGPLNPLTSDHIENSVADSDELAIYEERSNTTVFECPICKQQITKTKEVVWSGLHKQHICRDCHYKDYNPSTKDEKQLNPKKCDICDVVVNENKGVKNILDVGFVCNNCVITHGRNN